MSRRDDNTQVAASVPFDTSNNDFPPEIDDTQAAIEYAKQNAEGFPRAGISLVMNGTMSDGDWVTYSNLTPNRKIIFPVETKLNELTWDNDSTNVSFDLEIYKNGTAPANLVYTYEVRNNLDGFDYLQNIDLSFAAGDWIRIKYIDQGTNARDFVLTLWISRIVI